MEPQYLDDLAALNKDGDDYIRLLRVHTPSSRPKNATLCELRVFSLRHAPRYSALSYCRQPEDGTANINVRGSVKGSFPISHDVRSAMRAVHQHRWSDWLWIDALCINQSSTDEKNDQVPRVRAIYETAYAGFIWLGSAPNRVPVGSGDQKDAKNLGTWDMRTLTFDAVSLEIDKITGPEIRSMEARNADRGLTREKVMQLSRLSEKHRAWWCRTWIIQEMVLPARLYVCIGIHMMDWDQFVSACDVWKWYVIADTPVLEEPRARLKRLDGLRKQWQSAKYSLDTLELLLLGHESHATDARDYFYGVLGIMSPQDKQHVRVDYGRTIDQIYAEITAMLINKYQTLDLIVEFFCRRTEVSQPWLPSWVIDYGVEPYGIVIRRIQIRPLLKSFESPYRAGGRTLPFTAIDDCASKLHLEAVSLDRVVETLESDEALSEAYCRPSYNKKEHRSDSSDEGYGSVPQWLRSWLLSAIRLIQSCAERGIRLADARRTLRRQCCTVDILRYADPCFFNMLRLAYGCVITADKSAMLDDIVLNIEVLNDNLVREHLSSEHSGYSSFMHAIKYTSSRRILFATECGFVGWAKHDPRQSFRNPGPLFGHSVRKDDIIVVPRGASKPWILRETEVKGEYKLIIDCLVYGIMYGELMSRVESGQLQTQRYTLV